jgi:hypothetical protein
MCVSFRLSQEMMVGPRACSFRQGDAVLRTSGPEGHHTSWSLLYLGQHCFRLRQPEGHLHSAVELDGTIQLGAGLGAASNRGIERPKAVVAMGLERPHP